jgi:hypothetical protein
MGEYGFPVARINSELELLLVSRAMEQLNCEKPGFQRYCKGFADQYPMYFYRY